LIEMPRNCTVCRHAQRHEIEADLQAGLSYRDVARRYNTSKDIIGRHRAHISPHSATAHTTVTKAMAILDEAETSASWNVSLRLVQEARHCLKELLMQL
jgi:hypothetical protein